MNSVIFVSLVLVLVIATMTRLNRHTDAIIWAGVTALIVLPIKNEDGQLTTALTLEDAVEGFANPAVITIAALFVVAAGLRESGVLQALSARFFRTKNPDLITHQLLWPTAALSSFFNNTPLMALLLPVVTDLSKRFNLSVSHLLMPLSFASILGGACTLIGTSTNLVINGWIMENSGHSGLGMFEMSPLMVPIAIVGLIFIILATQYLVPKRKPVFKKVDNPKEYVVEMEVTRGSDLSGLTIDEAGLRGLPGLFLIEIERRGQILPAVSANVVLADGDRLIFAGIVESVVELQKISGLRPATEQVFKLGDQNGKRQLIEAVVSDSCPFVGTTIKEGRFRTIYNAAIIAVARNGDRVFGKIGSIKLRAGDVLLLETRASFLEQQRNSKDFYLVTHLDALNEINPTRSRIAFAILGIFVGLVTTGVTDMASASMLAAIVMVATRCVSPNNARKSIDWELLLVIAGALALGKAMQQSGLATLIGDALIFAVGDRPYLLLSSAFILTAILSALIGAKAGVLLVLPIMLSASQQLQLSFTPLIFITMLAASMTVASPIGYPTNLMVYGPGGYRFTDYLRLGVPLTFIIGILGVILTPLIWPFDT